MAEFISEYYLAMLMVVSLLAGIFTGYPVAFLLGGLGIIFAFIHSRITYLRWCGRELVDDRHPALRVYGPNA